MSTLKKRWHTVFYWLGAALALACFASILGRDTRLLARFEHAAFPLSWALAGGALLALLLYEFCHSAPRPPRIRPVPRAEQRGEWEADSFQKPVV